MANALSGADFEHNHTIPYLAIFFSIAVHGGEVFPCLDVLYGIMGIIILFLSPKEEV
jgi:hypothetical protein